MTMLHMLARTDVESTKDSRGYVTFDNAVLSGYATIVAELCEDIVGHAYAVRHLLDNGEDPDA